MAKIKLKINEMGGGDELVVDDEVKPFEKKEVLPKAVNVTENHLTKGFMEKVPANFSIIQLDDGKIMAKSARGDSFVGTIEEFNKKLRS